MSQKRSAIVGALPAHQWNRERDRWQLSFEHIIDACILRAIKLRTTFFCIPTPSFSKRTHANGSLFCSSCGRYPAVKLSCSWSIWYNSFPGQNVKGPDATMIENRSCFLPATGEKCIEIQKFINRWILSPLGSRHLRNLVYKHSQEPRLSPLQHFEWSEIKAPMIQGATHTQAVISYQISSMSGRKALYSPRCNEALLSWVVTCSMFHVQSVLSHRLRFSYLLACHSMAFNTLPHGKPLSRFFSRMMDNIEILQLTPECDRKAVLDSEMSRKPDGIPVHFACEGHRISDSTVAAGVPRSQTPSSTLSDNNTWL